MTPSHCPMLQMQTGSPGKLVNCPRSYSLKMDNLGLAPVFLVFAIAHLFPFEDDFFTLVLMKPDIALKVTS